MESLRTDAENVKIDIKDYTEPQEIIKTELFDEDVYFQMVNDNENFNDEEIKELRTYFKKNRVSKGKARVKYVFGEGCEKLRLGRIFGFEGLVVKSKKIRNPLFQKFYWDIDFVNCHFFIARYYLIKYNLSYSNINNYILNRAEFLQKAHSDRKTAKEKFLTVAFGGCANSECEEVNSLLQGIKSELDELKKFFNRDYDYVYKNKFGKKGFLKDKTNPENSLMSLIFQTKEREMLLFLDWFFYKKGRNMDVLIHDGGLIRKLKDEETFPDELLREAEEYIYLYFGVNMELAQKEIEHDYVIEEQVDYYLLNKPDFEQDNFMLQGDIINIMRNGDLHTLSYSKAQTKYKCMNWPEIVDGKKKDIYFLDKWIKDIDRKAYERIDFIPDVENCPDHVYNLFKGFNAEKLRPEIEFSNDEINELIKPIINHLNLLCSGDSDYMIKWLANIVQSPHNKSGTAPLFRDMDNLLEKGGGLGKNMFFDWFGNEILGSDYYVVVGDNKELYDNFNGMFEGVLLILVEEANARTNHQNLDSLKSKITKKILTVNKKGISQYKSKDYSRYVFNTNNYNALPDNRRFFFYDCLKNKRGDKEYFVSLGEVMKNKNVIWAFYKYLLNIDTYSSEIEFMNKRPKTDAMYEVIRINAPLHVKWICEMISNRTMKKLYEGEVQITTLYDDFKNWAMEHKQKDVQIMTLNAFSRLLNNSLEYGNKKKTSLYNVFSWNFDNIIKSLKKSDYISPYFDYDNEFYDRIQNIDDLKNAFDTQEDFEKWIENNNEKYNEIISM